MTGMLQWGNLHGSSTSLLLAELLKSYEGPILVITDSSERLEQLKNNLSFFNTTSLPSFSFPGYETLPYDHFSPSENILSERLLGLYRLSSLTRGMVLTAMPTLMSRLMPKQYLQGQVFAIQVGETIPLESFKRRLVETGYLKVSQVLGHGEFAIHGSILDLFPMGSKMPFRIEFFDEEVESIRSFDTDTQRSLEKLNNIQLLPAHEYPLNESGIEHFRKGWRSYFSVNPLECPLYKSVSQAESVPGLEYYLSLFFDKTDSLFDYLPSNTLIIQLGDLSKVAEEFWKEINHRYEQLRYDRTRPLCEPAVTFIPTEECFQKMKAFGRIRLQAETLSEKMGHTNFHSESLPSLLIDHKNKEPLKHIKNWLSHFSGKTLITADSLGRVESLRELLLAHHLQPISCQSWEDFIHYPDNVLMIGISPLAEGTIISNPAIAIITENQLFGESIKSTQTTHSRTFDPHVLIRNLSELSAGDPVVHWDYGVGRYQGLERIKVQNYEAEYMVLSYANNDKIYVPIASLHLISRYTDADAEHAPLQKLGSQQWEKEKDRIAKRVRDVAAELLNVYAKRQNSPGFACAKPDSDFQLFRASFPYEETQDQTKAIQDVIADMMRPCPMDRLICGDVGFGKTEVALQAAFLAVQNGKQVAALVPTTLLASQHVENFKNRFTDWPIKIAGLFRFISDAEQKKCIESLATGRIDIVISTHKLLQPAIKFKNLGLLIIDEEHRFGVRQKEYVKSIKANVDVLTLTATPIPRTLNLSLSGTRDLSIITTPPLKRLPVKTFLHEFNESLIREAILRESLRGGQCYFLHNDIDSIHKMTDQIQKIVPQARVAIAHGQMKERELEKIMFDFYHQKTNILVCTTIIESGIDIPTANTIIINRADKFGLAQLHQLRGRVGRSHHQAYAYLLTPPQALLKSGAKKRLEAIVDLEALGSGFLLATHDLEIRGAGELLGEEQSGHIHTVGFSLYMELLEEAVQALKSGEEPQGEKSLHKEPEIDLKVTALMPEDYIGDIGLRLTLYKRLSACQNEADIETFKIEVIDRFGPLPLAAQQLIKLTQLKLLCQKVKVAKITTGSKFVYIHFEANPSIDIEKLLSWIQIQPTQFSLTHGTTLKINMEEVKELEKVDKIAEILKRLYIS